jgi:glycosyltransferase involved in cell wall biosynthesis
MDISVIVPFHNSEAWVEACIQALLNQTYSEGCCEYIFVDNNSTDGSAAIVKRYPAVRLLSETKRGSYAARNRGLQEAGGEIIAFTDSDCVPRPDWLEQIARSMREPGVEMVLGRREFPPGSRVMQLLAAYDAEKVRHIFSGRSREQYYGYTNNMAVRKSFIDVMGPFLEIHRGGDTIFVKRAVNRYGAAILRYSPDVRVLHSEMTSVGKWCQKMLAYGRSHQKYRRIVAARSLSSEQRLQIFKRVAASNELSVLDCVKLSLVLAAGMVHWFTGRFTGMLELTAVGRFAQSRFVTSIRYIRSRGPAYAQAEVLTRAPDSSRKT